MITFFQFYRAWGLPNASPFCMKVETYLRMAKIPYEVKFVNNPQKSPKRKLPYIKMEGLFYPDSELIVYELKKHFGDVLDEGMTKEQKAIAQLVEVAFAERLYWVEVYMRWQEEAGWNFLKETMFGKLPAISKLIIPQMVRKNMLKELNYQGMGRHNLHEVLQLGMQSLDSLAVILGDNKYFMGDKPTSIDATAFAFLANVICTPMQDPLKQYAMQFTKFIDYCNLMWDEYYADFPKPKELIRCSQNG